MRGSLNSIVFVRMLRGMKRVKCPHRGHRFLAMDIEDNGTVNSMLTICPMCRKRVRLRNDFGEVFYKLPELLPDLEGLQKYFEGVK